MPRPDDLQLFMRIEIGRTTTGARTAVSTGRVVDEAFAMAVDVEPASSGGSGLDRKRFLLRRLLRRSGASVIKTLASQTRPDDDSLAASTGTTTAWRQEAAARRVRYHMGYS